MIVKPDPTYLCLGAYAVRGDEEAASQAVTVASSGELPHPTSAQLLHALRFPLLIPVKLIQVVWCFMGFLFVCFLYAVRGILTLLRVGHLSFPRKPCTLMPRGTLGLGHYIIFSLPLRIIICYFADFSWGSIFHLKNACNILPVVSENTYILVLCSCIPAGELLQAAET